jgi:Ca2+-binding EF-hand superfamily protein
VMTLSCMIVQVIAENLSEEEIAGLKEMFKMMDTDNSGQINFEELKAGLHRVGANMKEPEIHQLMQAVRSSLFCALNIFAKLMKSSTLYTFFLVLVLIKNLLQ